MPLAPEVLDVGRQIGEVEVTLQLLTLETLLQIAEMLVGMADQLELLNIQMSKITDIELSE